MPRTRPSSETMTETSSISSGLVRLLMAGSLAGGLLLGAMAGAKAEPRQYVLDDTHLSIAFLVDHIGYAATLGMFTEASGSFTFDEEAPAVSDITVTIQTASVFTNHKARDGHLRSKDFLWADEHPEITFVGTSAEQTGERTGKIHGDLTIRGVTQPVTLDATWNKSGVYPFGDKHWAVGVSARATVKRSDFGMTYAQGGIVGDEVSIILEFEGIRQE